MLPTSVRCLVRSTHNSTTCPSSSTAMRDTWVVALMTISRGMGGDCRLPALMPLTIYFAGAISGGRGDVAHYRRVVEALSAEGYRVLAGAVAAEGVSAAGELLDPCAIFERDVEWLSQADVLVAEVSAPSTGVGYEIATARYRYDIPVICLYRPAYTKRCSAMVGGDRGIELIEYVDAADMLSRLMASLAKDSAGEPGYSRRRTPA